MWSPARVSTIRPLACTNVNLSTIAAHRRGSVKVFVTILKDCAADIHHRLGGQHALGGERHDREALGRWFERLGRLGPTLKLTVRDVWIKGWPHNTTIIIRWVGTQTLPDGAPYENHGVQQLKTAGRGSPSACSW
jgi:hypothetical protein